MVVVMVMVVLVLRFDCITPVLADWLCSAKAEAAATAGLRYSTYDMLEMRATQNGVTFGQRNGGTKELMKELFIPRR